MKKNSIDFLILIGVPHPAKKQFESKVCLLLRHHLQISEHLTCLFIDDSSRLDWTFFL